MNKIYNSLGSNYDHDFRAIALSGLFGNRTDRSQELIDHIQTYFSGETILTYKGRDAISIALEILDIGKGDQVITQAFSCHAIEFAIERVGATAKFVDLHEGNVHPTIAEYDKILKLAPQTKAVIVQHTLGMPAQIKEIRAWCDQHHLWLIEDLAQAVGARQKDGKLLGSLADVVVLSFGRDKLIDGVSGGACICQSKKIDSDRVLSVMQSLSVVPKTIVVRDLLYPWMTWLIKRAKPQLLGKIWFKLCVYLGLIKSPVWSPLANPAQLPITHSNLVLYQWHKLSANLSRRQKKAKIYHKYLSDISLHSIDAIDRGSNLRYSILVTEPAELVGWLKKNQVEVADRWYRQAVDSGKLNYHSVYKNGSCQVAEYLASRVVNLPTHDQISDSQVEKVAKLVCAWKDTHEI